MSREIKFRIWDGEDMGEASYMKLPTASNDFIKVMQYTGLKDKNGKEVYEGDIVTCSSGCPHRVEWVQEHGGTYSGGMPAFYLSGLNSGYSWTGEEEIIGNIYEEVNTDESESSKQDTTNEQQPET